MPERQLIARPAKDTPAELRTGGGAARALPDDLLRQASRRLEIVALLAAVLWTVGSLLGHLTLYLSRPESHRWAQFHAVDAIPSCIVVTSLALYLYLHTGARDPAFVTNLGLAYRWRSPLPWASSTT